MGMGEIDENLLRLPLALPFIEDSHNKRQRSGDRESHGPLRSEVCNDDDISIFGIAPSEGRSGIQSSNVGSIEQPLSALTDLTPDSEAS
jgi:hypothetical protein